MADEQLDSALKGAMSRQRNVTIALMNWSFLRFHYPFRPAARLIFFTLGFAACYKEL
jgi:hypothetical protein